MSATPQLIKELRAISGAGMLDCKKALNKTGGDIDKSLAFLRESGLLKAAKKSGNIAAEGLISMTFNDNFSKATICEVNSQTDFVAKNKDFLALLDEITTHIHNTWAKNTHELNSTTINGTTFEEYLNSKIAIIGENIVARRMANIEITNGIINGYIHTNGKVGVILSATCSDEAKDKTKILLKNIAMHAAAMKPKVISYKDIDQQTIISENKAIIADITKENEELSRLKKALKVVPKFVSRSQLTEDILYKQKQIFEAQLKEQGKPEKIWDKIVPGKLSRFIEDNTILDNNFALLSQTYVLDDSKKVEQAIKDTDPSIKIVDYVIFELGDGVEKKQEDFASEVAAQMK